MRAPTLPQDFLGWGAVLRLALVQTAIGAVTVLATSTLNRIMIVELALPAILPAALVATHYLVQLVRLHHGHRVDLGGRSTPRIIGGLAVLAGGAVSAALATVWMQHHLRSGVALAVLAYVLVGIGIGASGTANLALLSKRVAPARRPLVAALVWIMMIAGFSVSAALAGHFLQPFSARRLIEVFAGAGTLAFVLGALAVRGIEARQGSAVAAAAPGRSARVPASLRSALRELWAEPMARRFTIFLFVSMLAFSAQELLLEPFAGLVFGFAPAASARLAGLQNAGVVAGMLLVVLAALLRRGKHVGFSLNWMIGGTSGSALAVAVLALIAARGLLVMLAPAAFVLGLANGAFAVAAIGVMMELSSSGGQGREGLRMGVWGAAQALAFAAGGLSAGGSVDLSRWLLGSAGSAYVVVFCLDAMLFVAAVWWALRLSAAHGADAQHFLTVNRGVAG